VKISAHIRIPRRGVLRLLAATAAVVLCAAAPGAAFAIGTDGVSMTNPWIHSDQADYPPGATVTLAGGNWSPGEIVHIVVDDTNGHTWSFGDDVTAGSDGLIETSFALPNTFISDYDVTATGPVSGTAVTTFTDGNVNVKTAGVSSAVVDWIRYNGATCSGAPLASGQIIATSGGNGTSLPGGAASNQSLQLSAEAVPGSDFTSWSGGNIPSPPNGANPICVAGENPTQQITASYTAAVTTRTTTTALALTTGTNPTTYGSPLAYTATVTAPGGSPTNVGTVTFSNGTTVLCNAVQLAGGAATCSPQLPAGGASVTAAYSGGVSGSVQFTSSSSSSLVETVNRKNLTVSGAVAQDKTYDASTTATVDFSGAGLVGVVSPDAVSIDSSTYTAAFASAAAGIGSAVTVSGVALSGDDAGNYTVSQPSGLTATIGLRPVTASITAADKTYDGARAASISGCSLETATEDHGVEPGDTVGCSTSNALFATKNAGAQPVSADVLLTGDASANYQLTSGTAATSATIEQRLVTASITAADKTYDGTTDATLTGCALDSASGEEGALAADTVGCDGSTAVFGSSQAGLRTVTADVSLTGADSGNYQLTSGTAATSATIEQRLVTASITAADKTYDGTTDATLTGCALDSASGDHGALAADTVGCDAASGRFATKDAGNQPVTADVSLTGADGENYRLTSATTDTTATITQRAVTATIAAADKTYDATRDAQITDCSLEAATGGHGVVSGDDVSCEASDGRFASAAAGVHTVTADVVLDGAVKADYQLTGATAATSASIGKAPLHISAVPDSKQYDGTTTSTATPTVRAGDLQGSDSVDGLVQAFQSKNVLGADASTLQVTGYAVHDGNGGDNYDVATATAVGTITPAPLHLLAASDAKQYDGTTTSTATPTVRAGDLQGSDSVDGLVQAFQSKNVLGANASTLQVTGYAVHDGNGGDNYNVSATTATGTITAKPLTVTGITAANKAWDGGTTATLNTSGAALNGVISPDGVGLDASGATGTFANSAVGTWTVQIAGLVLTGADTGNYSLTQPTASASISAWYATGFYDPVGIGSSLLVPAPGPAPAAATSTIWNTVKSGSTVPLKFNLYTSRGGGELRSTSSISTFDAVKLAACAGDTGDPVDFVTTGNTSLRYDTTGMQFIQNWKTPTAAASTCYRVDVKFQDGSAVYAFFKLTK
jgi:YDG domain-containing protein/Big-like domain-containing protein